jgi:hypothetical protein
VGRRRFTGPCKPQSRVRGRNYDEDAADRRRSRGYAGRAVSAGATQVRPVSEEHCWLLGRVADPFGHHWEIGKPLIECLLRPVTRPSV